MDLIFQVSMQYCSLQHWSLLPSPITFTTGHCFHFSSASSFSLELFSTLLQQHMVTYQPGEFTFQCHIFFAFSYCSWGSQGKNIEVVCHSLLQWDHNLSEHSTMTHPSWVALHSMAHSFIEFEIKFMKFH